MCFQKSILTKGCLLASLVVSSVNASAVSVYNDNRYVSLNGEVSSQDSNEYWRSQAYAPRNAEEYNRSYIENHSINDNESNGVADISSNLSFSPDGLQFSGAGEAGTSVWTEREEDARFRYTSGSARSEQEISFTLDRDMYFMLSGSLTYEESLIGSPSGGAYVSLRSSSYSSFNWTAGRSSAYSDFDDEFLLGGLLQAGTYYFEIYASSNSNVNSYPYYYYNQSEGSSASYDFDLVVSDAFPFAPPAAEVPVPAAAWLFGSAFLGLVGLKRKK